MQFLLSILVCVAVFAGYKGWPLYLAIPIAVAFTIWNLMYFGTRVMQIATGGPIAYLLRISIINIIQASVLYGAGFGLSRIIG